MGASSVQPRTPPRGEVMTVPILLLKHGLLLFWAFWLSITWLTNACDGLKALRLLGAGWWVASGNYARMVETTQKYALPRWLTALLFLGVVLWQGLAAGLFWGAIGAFQGMHGPGLERLHTAFGVSLALWAALMLADELLLVYEVEAPHMRIFMAQLISLLVLHLVPDGR
jgi:hypothetical protein